MKWPICLPVRFRRWHTAWGLLLLAGILLLSLMGCGHRADVPDGTLRYVLEQEPSTLDPAKSTTLPESSVELQLFDGLTRLTDKDEPAPANALSWQVSPDGLTYTFTLRPGLVWSDGSPLTARDYEYAWKRVLDPATASPNVYMLYVIKNAEAYFKGQVPSSEVGVKAVDDRTLVVTLQAPAAYFLSLTAFHTYYPVPEAVVKAHPDTWASSAETLIGNGPFVMTGWKHSGEIDFRRNEHYWDKANVSLAAMEWPISESQSTRLTLVEGGEADMMAEPPVADQSRLEKAGIFHVAPTLGTYYYVFNVKAEPFTDPRVRRALSLVLDRKAIVDNVVHGGKVPAYAFVPPGLTDPATGRDFRAEGGNLAEENRAEARLLLQEAGYGPDHPLPPFTILYNTNEMHKAIAETVQAVWKETLGLQAQLQNQETKVFLANREEGNYQVARASWVGDYADPQTFLDVFDDEDNDAGYHSEAYKAIMDEVHDARDPARRMAAMHRAEDLLFADGVIIPIYYTTGPYVANDQIGGYHWSILGTVDFKHAYRK